MRRLAFLILLAGSFSASARIQDALDPDEIVFLVENGLSDEQIILEVKARRIRFRMDEAAETQLQRKGVSSRILQVLHEVQLLDDVFAMRAAGKAEIDIIRMIAERGIQLQPTPDELLRLHRKRLSRDVVNALRGNFTFADFKTHEHPGGFFRVQHPDGWRKIEGYEDDRMIVAFTPEDRATTQSIETGFRIEMTVVGSKSPHASLPLETIHERKMRMLEAEAKEEGTAWAVLGTPKKVHVLGVPGIQVEYEHGPNSGKIRRRAVLLFNNGVEYWLACDAPAARFDACLESFEKILLTFNPAPDVMGKSVRKPKADPKDLLERFRPAVVQVTALTIENGAVVGGGAGTGFFVRRDGYLLTNHHVVYDRQRKRFRDRFTIDWDVSLNRPSVEAVLIDAVESSFPSVDIALLKANGAEFTVVPVTRANPPNKYVKELDSIVALGYPGVVEQRMGEERKVPLTLTSTAGSLSKFNLRPDGTVDDLIIDAAIHHGNSGGPCIDLETHSAIGLNTFGNAYEGKTVETYGGVIPIDAAFEYFPEIISYPESVEAKFTADDYLSLAIQYYNQGLYKPAARQLDKALALRPEDAEAFAVACDVLAALGNAGAALEFCQKALRVDPNNVRAIMGLANLSAEKALECYTKVLTLRPKDRRAFQARARLHQKAGRWNEAIADAEKACECSRGLSAEPFRLLGSLLYSLKRYDDGRAQYEKACAIDPRDVDAHFGLVDFHYMQGKYDDALQSIDQMAEKGQKDALWQKWSGEYYYLTAEKYQDLQQPQKADACFEGAYKYYRRAVALYEDWHQDPDSMTLLRFAWMARERKKDLDTAFKWYEKLTRMLAQVRNGKRENDPNLLNIYLNLGLLYREAKNEWMAQAFLQAAHDQNPNAEQGKYAQRLLTGARIPLTFDMVNFVVTKTSFGVLTAVDLFQASPLAFTLTPQDAEVLASKGWSGLILDVLLKGGAKGNVVKARDRDTILQEWIQKDARLVQEAKKIRYQDRNSLFQKYFQAHDRKEYATAIPGFKALFYRCFEEDRALAALAAYNAACGYSLTRATGEALDWFELCFYFGFFTDERDQVGHVEKDPDLDNIRNDPRFKTVVEAARKLRTGGRQVAGGATLGVKLRSLTAQERADRNLKAEVGIWIVSVEQGGPAAQAGLQEEDVVTAIGETSVGDADQLTAWIRAQRPETKITIGYVRDGEYWQVDVTLGREKGGSP